jgi:hypothetical protein
MKVFAKRTVANSPEEAAKMCLRSIPAKEKEKYVTARCRLAIAVKGKI